MNIAIIPARGGSKRLPGKNIREFCGQPIIKYSIDAAIDCGVFDRVIVTTDSKEIADVAKVCGAEVPFLRPAELSDDHTPTIPVIRHAIETIQQSGDSVDFACCVYATAPFVQSGDLSQGLKQLQSGDGEFAFPVTTFPFPIMRSLKIDDDQIEMIWPEHEMTRSQDLVEAWHDAGQFYWGTGEAWKTARGLYSANCLPIRIPRWRVQDIDTEEDWNRAQLMHRALCGEGTP